MATMSWDIVAIFLSLEDQAQLTFRLVVEDLVLLYLEIVMQTLLLQLVF